jgi:hypothetical protein
MPRNVIKVDKVTNNPVDEEARDSVSLTTRKIKRSSSNVPVGMPAKTSAGPIVIL